MNNNIWVDPISAPLVNAWSMFVAYIPRLLGAALIILVGWFIASLVAKVFERIFVMLKTDSVLSRAHYTMDGKKLAPSRVLSKIIFWLLIILFLIAGADALGLPALSDFLRQVVSYIPNVFIAAVILFISFQLAGFVRGLIEGSLEHTGANAARISGTVAWWAIIVFGIFAALLQLRIVESIINIIVSGLVFMLALAGGLAFGLGGRESAARLLGKAEGYFARKTPSEPAS